MAYSNVDIPYLPDMWDEIFYPNCIVQMAYYEDEEDWYILNLYASRTAFIYDDGIRHGADEYEWYVYSEDTEDGSLDWHYPLGVAGPYTGGLTEVRPVGLVDGVMCRYWTNHDIYDADGKLYLAADGVTPIKWSGLKDWIRGLVIGTASKPVPFGGVSDE